MYEKREALDDATLLLLRQLMRNGRVIEAWADSLLGEVDLSATRLFTLRQLEQADEPLSLSQLASCLAFVKSNATQLVDNLEASELVKRVPSPNDRRCTLLELTDEGKRRHEAAIQALQPLTDKLNTLYSPEELAHLLELLQRLSVAAK